MLKILIATSNQGKAGEMLEVLNDLACEFVTLADLDLANDVEEDGITYQENALKKAHCFFKQTGLVTIGEDSGIEVDALKGELGIYTRRWGAGERATDQEWLDFFLKRLANEQNRQATFNSAVALVDNSKEAVFTGKTSGILATKPEAPIPKGIPVSALFKPEGIDQVYAALDSHQKNQVSHRGKAIRALKDYLQKTYLAV
jgi:XTP/dITP diphosphohydrolase